MALIKCPECGNDVSTSAQSCPKCGFPIAQSLVGNSDSELTAQNPSSTNDVKIKEPFPELPVVMNVGKQIVNWGLDAAIQDAYYIQEVNYTSYIKEGKCSVMAHTNGICINSGLDFFYISHEQLIDMKFVTHKQLTSENKSVIGRAVLGGVLLGPVAAVVGGLSGIGTKTKKIGNYLLVINFWDVYTRQVQSLLLCTKVESINFISRVEKEKDKHNTPDGNNFVCNILDDDGHISDKKAIEALKIVGNTKLAEAVGVIEGCGAATAMVKVAEIGKRNEVDIKQYNSSGCLVTLLVMMTGIMSLLGLVIVL